MKGEVHNDESQAPWDCSSSRDRKRSYPRWEPHTRHRRPALRLPRYKPGRRKWQSSTSQLKLLRVTEVLIAGAGVMGAALAYWLTRLDPSCRVTLVEPDAGFTLASSSRSASSIRQQFSCPENVELSQFGIRFLREVHTHLSINEDYPQLGLLESGYLYLAFEAEAAALSALDAEQQALGVRTALLDRAALRARFPWLQTEDLALGRLGLEGEGWFDGPALHRAFLAKARHQGAQVLQDRVLHAKTPDHIALASGAVWCCKHFVCAAGAWSGALASASGIALAVHPALRTVFVLSCPDELPGMPLVIDPSGFWIRPEGRHFLLGFPPRGSILGAGPARLEPQWQEFDEAAWALLAQRLPAFAAMRIESAWAGYYEMHALDHNAVIGAHPEKPFFHFLCGFSGHGMQHAPGAALALAEQILGSGSRSLELSALGYRRVLENAPYRERNVIG